jgi:serine phosphatase RsbU (regulator of sigma subunit)
MKLRTRLVLALLFLAVLPLTGASVFAWWSSERAFRSVLSSEAGAMAQDLGDRMSEVVAEVDERLARMRERRSEASASSFEAARRDALAAAETVETRAVIRSMLGAVPRQEGEIPFAVDDRGEMLAATEAEVLRLTALGLAPSVRGGELAFFREGYVVVARREPSSGYFFGIARPMGRAAAEIRAGAVRNLGLGLGLVAFAVLGLLPLTRRITRDLESLEDGAAKLAAGDLDARVAVRSRDEIGRLAFAFNRMARDLSVQQERLLAEEGLKRELLTCRRIQAELLPHGPLETPLARVSGVSYSAREVGGDFFNYFTLPAGELALLVGDVSGKGLAAALLMANVQATLRGAIPMAWDLAAFAAKLDEDLHARTLPEAYLTLCFGILGPDLVLRYVNAGHNPPVLRRASGRVERLESTGRPLGLLPGGGYEERRLELGPADELVLFTDGVLDMENEAGEAFGGERLRTLLESIPKNASDGIPSRVADALRSWRGRKEPADDATVVVLRIQEDASSPAAA